MADLEVRNPEFEITVSLGGADKTILVKPDETSDGIEYFICFSGTEQITQIRLDEDGSWDQMWGDLSPEDVNAIGSVIQQK